jgi:putative oxidoreductase
MMFFLLSPYLAFLLRIVVGVTLVLHGYPKLKNPKQTLKWTESLGVPAAATIAAIVLEFFGGVALITGFLVPVVAFFIILEMIGNIALKKMKMKAPYLVGQNASAYEVDVLYILLAATLIVIGPGVFSASLYVWRM